MIITPYDFLPRLLGPETWTGPLCVEDQEHLWVSLGSEYSSYPDRAPERGSINFYGLLRCAACCLYANEYYSFTRIQAEDSDYTSVLVRHAKCCQWPCGPRMQIHGAPATIRTSYSSPPGPFGGAPGVEVKYYCADCPPARKP